MNAMDKMVKARVALVLEEPFYGALSLRLELVEADWLPTAATDGVSIYFNPEYIMGLNSERTKTLVAHEVMHCAHGHPWRRGSRDLDQWNAAADYSVNDTLQQSGFALWEGALLDPRFSNLASEQIYTKLNKPQDDADGDDDSQENGDEDQNQDQNNDDTGGTDNASGYEGDDQDGDDPGGTDNDGDGDKEGDGDGDREGEGEDPTTPDGRSVGNDPGGCGGVIDAPIPEGKSQLEASDIAELEQDWKVAVAQAAQNARAAGEMSGDLERMVLKELEPQADWASLLRQFMTAFARDDYSWSRPNRRHVAAGLYLPSVYSETVPPIVVAVDTSGSIDGETLAQFQGELNSILSDVRPEAVHVIYCDMQVNGVQEFTPDDFPIELEAKGGGGTMFQPVFDYVDEQDIEPACLVYLTDMWNFDDIEEPPYPVLWADYCQDGYRKEQAFGEHIIIE